MKKLLIAGLMAGAALAGPAAAHAGAATDAALALGAFAVFNQVVRGETVLHAGWGPPAVVVHGPARVHAPHQAWGRHPHRYPGSWQPHWNHGGHAHWRAWDKGHGHGPRHGHAPGHGHQRPRPRH